MPSLVGRRPLNAALGGFKRRSLSPSQFRSGFWGHLGISFAPFTPVALARREVGRGPEAQGGWGARCSPWRGHFPQAAPRALRRAGCRSMEFAVARISLRAAGAGPRASRVARSTCLRWWFGVTMLGTRSCWLSFHPVSVGFLRVGLFRLVGYGLRRVRPPNYAFKRTAGEMLSQCRALSAGVRLTRRWVARSSVL